MPLKTLKTSIDVDVHELPVLNFGRLIDEEADISATPSPVPSPPLGRGGLHANHHESLVMRRQPSRPREGGGAKRFDSSSARFVNLTSDILDDLQFSGWGTNTRIDQIDLLQGVPAKSKAPINPKFGPWQASGIAGNAVLGSVFYAFPAVAQIAGIWSPLSLLIACMTFFLFRPIMSELESAFPFNAANYSYILNTASKTFALVVAAMALLDAATTSAVSAASFSAYLEGEVSLPFPGYWITVITLIAFTAICLIGLKESVSLTFTIFCLHIASMFTLFMAALVHWLQSGNAILVENWLADRSAGPTATLKAIFYGACLGLLGLTGFECVAMSAELIRPGGYPKVLRNLHLSATLLNAPLMLLVFANLPVKSILSGANVLSLLGETSSGRWLRILVVVDASVVLSGGVLTGFLSIVALLERLTRDRVLPQLFQKRIALTHALYWSIISAGTLSLLIYVSTGANLTALSSMFSLVFLVDMALFPIALTMLKFHRNRIPRSPKVSLEFVVLALFVLATMAAGNIAIKPIILGYFAVYWVAITLIFVVLGNTRALLVLALWVLDQSWLLHRFRFTRRPSSHIARLLRRIRRQPIVYFTKTDSLNHLVAALRYIQENESTANVKLCHVYTCKHDIPSELEANHRIVDEAFPAITVDLILIKGTFSPKLVEDLAHKLKVPLSLVFISCPGDDFKPPFSEWGDIRIVLR